MVYTKICQRCRSQKPICENNHQSCIIHGCSVIICVHNEYSFIYSTLQVQSWLTLRLVAPVITLTAHWTAFGCLSSLDTR